jgi:hypothetical protein
MRYGRKTAILLLLVSVVFTTAASGGDTNTKLVEFEGQGRGIKGLDNYITFYNVWVDFLEDLEG